MGKIELDHTGSGSGITLSSDGTDLLLDGTAIGGSAFDTPEVKTSSWSVANADKGKVFIVDTDNLTLTLPQYSTLDDDWFIRVYTKGNGFQPSYGNPGDLTIDPQYSTYSGRVNGNTEWVMKSRQGGLLFKDPEASNNFIFDTHSTNWDIDTNSTANANRANATGWGSVAILGQATASGTNSISIGYLATASGTDSVALGSNSASATATDAVALGNSLASGSDSFAANIENNTSSYGAQGTGSIAIGTRAKSVSNQSIAIGHQTQTNSIHSVAIGYGSEVATSSNGGVAIGQYSKASSTGAIAIGYEPSGYYTHASGYYSLAIGHRSYASRHYSYAFGHRSSSDRIGKLTYASGCFSTDGDVQGGQYILRAATTNATATKLTTDGGSLYSAGSLNQIYAASDTAVTFDGTITATQNGAQSYASWKIEGLLVNDGGTTTLANSAITVIQNASSWGLALAADDTNDVLTITVTGEASHNIRWVANIRTTEVTYA